MKVFTVAILQHFLASIENNIYRIHFSGGANGKEPPLMEMQETQV